MFSFHHIMCLFLPFYLFHPPSILKDSPGFSLKNVVILYIGLYNIKQRVLSVLSLF
jgi:hypothetical protein